ncbi:TetR/AcrR family transcriptional regulator [Azospirillum sp. ST 5-10]|uniref:TetR/AcrR family transcriptional regulator n=1 Tax=unclassified Azospirillum TaxID=2630922 RepID=UPI003F4A780C
MGRPPTIDRDKVLDIAERILLESGTSGLTIDAVAKAAGISKGGVQSRFGTKNDLIQKLVERWTQEYEAKIQAIAGTSPDPVAAVRGHIDVSLDTDEAENARAAGLMAALIEANAFIDETQGWYREKLAGLDLRTDEGRRARLAFFATEGAFMLRAFRLYQADEDEWRSLIADLRALVDGER